MTLGGGGPWRLCHPEWDQCPHKGDPGSCPLFLPCDVTVRRQQSMRKWVFPDSMILRFPASRLWGINVVYKPPSLWHFCCSSLNRPRHFPSLSYINMLISFLVASLVFGQYVGSVVREGWGKSSSMCRISVGFISTIVLGEVLRAGLCFNIPKRIVAYTIDLGLGVHFCPSPTSTASCFRFWLAHLPHNFHSLLHIIAKNSLSYLKAGSFSWYPGQAGKLRAIWMFSDLYLKYPPSPQILTSLSLFFLLLLASISLLPLLPLQFRLSSSPNYQKHTTSLPCSVLSPLQSCTESSWNQCFWRTMHGLNTMSQHS